MKKILIQDTVQGRIIRLSVGEDDLVSGIFARLTKRYAKLRDLDGGQALGLFFGEQVLDTDGAVLAQVEAPDGKPIRFELRLVQGPAVDDEGEPGDASAEAEAGGGAVADDGAAEAEGDGPDDAASADDAEQDASDDAPPAEDASEADDETGAAEDDDASNAEQATDEAAADEAAADEAAADEAAADEAAADEAAADEAAADEAAADEAAADEAAEDEAAADEPAADEAAAAEAAADEADAAAASADADEVSAPADEPEPGDAGGLAAQTDEPAASDEAGDPALAATDGDEPEASGDETAEAGDTAAANAPTTAAVVPLATSVDPISNTDQALEAMQRGRFAEGAAKLLAVRGLIDPKETDGLAERSYAEGRGFLDLLIETQRGLRETVLLSALASTMGCSWVGASSLEAEDEARDALSGAAATALHAMPFEHRGDDLVIAVENPLHVEKKETLERLVGGPVVLYMALPSAIEAKLEAAYGTFDEAAKAAALAGAPDADEREESEDDALGGPADTGEALAEAGGDESTAGSSRIASEGFQLTKKVEAPASQAAADDVAGDLKPMEDGDLDDERTMLPVELGAMVAAAKAAIEAEEGGESSAEPPIGPPEDPAEELAPAGPIVDETLVSAFNQTRKRIKEEEPAHERTPTGDQPALKDDTTEIEAVSTQLPVEGEIDKSFKISQRMPAPDLGAAAVAAAASAAGVTQPTPPPPPARAMAPGAPPAPAPAGSSGFTPQPTELVRRADARYYDRMHPLQNFPLDVLISKGSATLTGGQGMSVVSTDLPGLPANRPKLTLVPCFPGCLCVPPSITLDVSAQESRAHFSITPLVEGALPDARLEVHHDGAKVASLSLPATVVKTSFARFAFTAGFILPLMTGLFDLYGLRPQTLSEVGRLLAETGFEPRQALPYAMLAGIALIGLSGVLFLLKRPRKAEPRSGEVRTA